MRRLLLDEHVSPGVVPALLELNDSIEAIALQAWRDGGCLGLADEVLLSAAREDLLTLVTYDLRTVVPLLVRFSTAATSHAGVILVDDRTLSPADIGGLARALGSLWTQLGSADWTDRVVSLRRSPPIDDQ